MLYGCERQLNMSITLKVNPEILKTKASEIESDIHSLENDFNSILDVISRTTAYWQGISADKARREFQGQKDDALRIIKRFREYPLDLMTMAGVYEKTESDILSDNNVLNTDVIV